MRGAAIGRDGVLILSIVAACLHMLKMLERYANALSRHIKPEKIPKLGMSLSRMFVTKSVMSPCLRPRLELAGQHRAMIAAGYSWQEVFLCCTASIW